MRTLLDDRGLTIGGLLGLALLAAVLVAVVGPGAAAAQPATGTLTGRVVWSPCARVPLPASSDGSPEAATSGTAPSTADQSGGSVGAVTPAAPDATAVPNAPLPPGVASRPQSRLLPAGAVLVAVQNTALSTRTDDTGHFSIDGVPAGQYLTVAAGPVGQATDAVAERPNALVSGGQSVDVGTLVLGGVGPGALGCRVVSPLETPGDTP